MQRKMFILIIIILLSFLSCENNVVESKSELAAPSNLWASSSGHSNIRLKWVDNSKSESGFILESKDKNSAWQKIADLPENTTSYTDVEKDFKQTYYYRLRAFSNNEQSKYSNEVSFSGTNFFELIFVEEDTFIMGDTWGENDPVSERSRPAHQVYLSSYFIGKYEITNQQLVDVFNWALSNGKINVSSFLVFLVNGDHKALIDMSDYNTAYSFSDNKFSVVYQANFPATDISWYGSVAYCNFLSEKYGFTPCYDLNDWSCDWSADGFRLPTEAEWEFAARGGNKSLGYKYSGSNNPEEVAWYYLNSGRGSHEVGTKLPNELGIYDMTGNVWEWCWDYWGFYSAALQINPTGAISSDLRIIRGSAWYGAAASILYRVTDRYGYDPTTMATTFGLRISRKY